MGTKRLRAEAVLSGSVSVERSGPLQAEPMESNDMVRQLKMVAVAAGAVCLVATTANAAEMRVPSTAPMTTAGSTIALPNLAEAPAVERMQVAQRRRGAGRRAGRRFRGGRRVVRNRGVRRFRGSRRRGRRGRRIGRGVAIGLGALAIGAIAAEAARANGYRGGRCGRWLRACENGSYRSCRRYDRNC